MIPALLLGRKGSVGLPGKNTRLIKGKPLAAYPMQAAKLAPSVDQVFLSTDDPELMKIARQNNVEVIERPAYLCTNQALGEDAYKHGYEEICKRTNQAVEILVLMFCNAPTVLPSQIEEAIQVLKDNPEVDSAVTVSRYNMWSPLRARRIGSDGLLHPFVSLESIGDPSKLNCDRDSQGDAWFADVALSVVRAKNFEHIEQGLLPQKWMGRKIHPIKNEAGLDVDYEWQVPMVEWWIENKLYREIPLEQSEMQIGKAK